MSKKTFCYLCGTVTHELHEGLCKDCFLKEKELVHLPKRMEVEMCRECMSYYSGRWEDEGKTLEESLQKIAQKEVERNLKHELEEAEIKVSVLSIEGKGKSHIAELEVEVAGLVNELEYSAKLRTALEIKQVLCPICSKRAGGYFEAVIQLRTHTLESMLKEAHTVLNNLYLRDKKAFIAGVSRVKGGADIKLGSSKAAKALAAHFKTHHKAEIKESATLVGRKDGKDVYRTTVLIRV